MNVSSVNGISNSLYCQGSKPAKIGELDNGNISFGANPLKAKPLPLTKNFVQGIKKAAFVGGFMAFVGSVGAFIGAKVFGTSKAMQQVVQAATREADSLKNIIKIKDADIYRLTTKSDALSEANEVLTKKVTQLEDDAEYYFDVVQRINSDPIPVSYKIINDKKTKTQKIVFDILCDSITTSNGHTYLLHSKTDDAVFTKNKDGISGMLGVEIYEKGKKSKKVMDTEGIPIYIFKTIMPNQIREIMNEDKEAAKVIKNSIVKGQDFSSKNFLEFIRNTPDSALTNAKFWLDGREINRKNGTYERFHLDPSITRTMNLNRTDKK